MYDLKYVDIIFLKQIFTVETKKVGIIIKKANHFYNLYLLVLWF